MAIERKTRREKEHSILRIQAEMARKPRTETAYVAAKTGVKGENIRSGTGDVVGLKRDILLSLGMLGGLIAIVAIISRLENVREGLQTLAEQLFHTLVG